MKLCHHPQKKPKTKKRIKFMETISEVSNRELCRWIFLIKGEKIKRNLGKFIQNFNLDLKVDKVTVGPDRDRKDPNENEEETKVRIKFEGLNEIIIDDSNETILKHAGTTVYEVRTIKVNDSFIRFTFNPPYCLQDEDHWDVDKLVELKQVVSTLDIKSKHKAIRVFLGLLETIFDGEHYTNKYLQEWWENQDCEVLNPVMVSNP